jgi:two-component system, OmpR family, phosphate regulon response regulator PhoB
MASILIVEDEISIAELVSMTLSNASHSVHMAATAAAAHRQVVESRPDLVVLDWMLPDRSGLELAQLWRRDRSFSQLPILMLTARSEEADIVAGLEAGVDDYLTKPFSPKELTARVNAILRRAAPDRTATAVEAGGIRLDPALVEASFSGEIIKLSPMEFRLLHYFMKNPSRVHARDRLLDHVWGGDAFLEERTVDVHIKRLRAVLEKHGCAHYIDTVRGVGYRFDVPAATT